VIEWVSVNGWPTWIHEGVSPHGKSNVVSVSQARYWYIVWAPGAVRVQVSDRDCIFIQIISNWRCTCRVGSRERGQQGRRSLETGRLALDGARMFSVTLRLSGGFCVRIVRTSKVGDILGIEGHSITPVSEVSPTRNTFKLSEKRVLGFWR